MNRLFVIFFLLIMTSAVASVLDATSHSEARVVDGVRVEKVATSASSYVYWSFTNTNPHSVEVIYSVSDYPAVKFILTSGGNQRSSSAYAEALECQVSVRRL